MSLEYLHGSWIWSEKENNSNGGLKFLVKKSIKCKIVQEKQQSIFARLD